MWGSPLAPPEAEQAARSNDSKKLYRCARMLSGWKPRPLPILLDEHDCPTQTPLQRAERWQRYFGAEVFGGIMEAWGGKDGT